MLVVNTEPANMMTQGKASEPAPSEATSCSRRGKLSSKRSRKKPPSHWRAHTAVKADALGASVPDALRHTQGLQVP